MLAALPSTVPKEKFGARLMQYVKGEAELVCETIDVEKLCADGGDKAVFSLLDDKYGPQPTDLLHKALKGFFYELAVQKGETYQQFMARFYHANRRLAEQDVKLPEKVLGFTMLKKTKLDATAEAMVLTATKGSMEQKDVLEAFKNIFPEGKGPNAGRAKDVLVTEGHGNPEEEEADLQEALQAVVDDLQATGAADDEEILEAFESYAEVRRKMAEKKKSRGFVETSRWKLSGTVNGKLEQLKARTKCHLCKRTGHWRRECPRNSAKGGSGRAPPPAPQAAWEKGARHT